MEFDMDELSAAIGRLPHEMQLRLENELLKARLKDLELAVLELKLDAVE